MDLKKSFVWILSSCLLCFCSYAETRVVQGTMSNGTPYYYTVSDTPVSPNITVTKYEPAPNISTPNYAVDTATQREAEKKAEEERKAEEARKEAIAKKTEEIVQKMKAEREEYEKLLRAEAEERAAEIQRQEEEYRLAEERKAAEEKEKQLAEEAIAKAEAAAKEAANEYETAKKKYSELIEKAVEKEETIMNNKKMTRIEAEYARQELLHAQYEERVMTEALQNLNEKMISSYEALSTVYKEYSCVGDPVELSTGRYIAEYVDFAAQDFSEVFKVSRKYEAGIKGESFGDNWACSLDSRIVRGCNDSWMSELQMVWEELDLLYQAKKSFDDYEKNYGEKYPREEIKELIAETTEKERKILELQNFIEKSIDTNCELMALNKYVAYGKYESIDNCCKSEKLLKYYDGNGNEYVFESDEKGSWLPIGLFSKNQMKLIENADGSYVLEYLDGRKKEYSRYGVLEKEIDRNGNETLYWNENGRITKIQLKTGEELTVQRNASGFITSIQGEVSGNTRYTYEGNHLVTVLDNEGVKVSYGYNSSNLLEKIKKADGAIVHIDYAYSSAREDFVCSSVQLNGELTEYFDWDFDERKLKHITYDGKVEDYVFNEDGNPVYVKDADENIISFETDDRGLIVRANNNGNEKHFYYNQQLQPETVCLWNGGEVNIQYGEYGLISSVRDADGFEKKYIYDSKGNLRNQFYNDTIISSYTYYPNGLVKSIYENNIETKYEYNSFGSITKKITDCREGNHFYQKWEYDDLNRPVYYKDEGGFVTEYFYDGNRITEIYNNRKKTERFYDEKKREYETVTTDLLTGESHSQRKEYDYSGNVKKVYLDGEIYQEFIFGADSRLLNKKVWNLTGNASVLAKQAVVTDYVYGKKGFLIEERSSVIEETSSSDKKKSVVSEPVTLRRMNYLNSFNQTQVQCFDQFGFEKDLVYNCAGNLIKETFRDGTEITTRYSKAGRVLEKKDKQSNIYLYNYNRDGSYYVVKQDIKGNQLIYYFSERNLLESIKGPAGKIKDCTYDSEGNLIGEKGPGYTKFFCYDVFNRLVDFQLISEADNSVMEYSLFYDDDSNVISLLNKGDCVEFIRCDAWNRCVEVKNKKGNTWFKYDGLNNKIMEGKGFDSVVAYEYDPFGNVAYVLNEDGSETSYVRNLNNQVQLLLQNERTLFGQTNDYESRNISKLDSFGRKTDFIFDDTGFLKEEIIDGLGTKTYQWNENHSTVKIQRSGGGKSVYSFDFNGQVVSEENPSGKKADYAYDVYGRLVKEKTFDGTVKNYEYLDEENLTRICYSNGENTEIQSNAFGLITKLKNKSGEYEYLYDSYGNLVTFKDVTANVKVHYSYDTLGRCVEKSSDLFDFEYFYNEQGRCEAVLDLFSGNAVSFRFDERGREIERRYSNGTVTRTVFNGNNLVESKVTENSSGEIIAADFLIYDDKGRLCVRGDKNGQWTSYSYDSAGRLESCIYPNTEKLMDFFYIEALECGINNKEKFYEDKVYSLSEKDCAKLRELVANTSGRNRIGIENRQKGWLQKYSYTETGCVSTVENQYGKIQFEYDLAGKVIAKHGSNSRDSGMFFNWDDNGNLISAKNQYGYVNYQYGELNRPEKLTVVDYETGNTRLITFEYDGMGRRITQTFDNQETCRYVYDGFSLDPLLCVPVGVNNSVVAGLTGGNKIGGNVSASGLQISGVSDAKSLPENYGSSEIRWVDDYGYTANNPLENFDSSSYEENGNAIRSLVSAKMVKTETAEEIRPFSMISNHGLPLFKLYLDDILGNEISCEYLITDYRGNCAAVCDGDSNCLGTNIYDAWGNPLEIGKNPSYSYSRSCINQGLFLYNLGFRDYAPAIMSFTTMDPVRDGSNWFAFCSTDPVNQLDNNGLVIIATGAYDLMTNYGNDVLLGNSNDERFNQAGCYVVTLANVIQTLINKYSYEKQEEYNSAMTINADKDLFSKKEGDEGCLNGSEIYMNKLFGEHNWGELKKGTGGIYAIKAELEKLDVSNEEYLVCVVFDLSEVNSKVSNHMVAINSNFNEQGKLDSKSDITASSVNDNRRLENYLDAYNLSNVKEIRYVKTGKKNCSK